MRRLPYFDFIMTSDNPHPHFSTLLAMNLINAEHYERALAHADAADMATRENEADALYWLVARSILRERDLENLEEQLEALPENEAGRAERLHIVRDALDAIDAFMKSFMQEPLGNLLKHGLIDRDQHAAGSDIRPTVAEGFIESPASALAVLRNRGIVTEEQFDVLKAQAAAPAQDAAAEERNAIVVEAEQIFDGMVDTYVKAMSGGTWRLFLLLMMPVFLVIGCILWLKSGPAKAPTCDDKEIVSTLDSLYFRVRIAVKSDPVNLMRYRHADPVAPSRLADHREVGYLTTDRIRGCMATSKSGDETAEIAYTVSFNAEDKIMVGGAHPEIVKARFGHLDANGNTLHTAAPIGRDKLDAAFREGVERFNNSLMNASSRQLQRAMERHRRKDPALADKEREREIVDIEPLECHALTTPDHVSCKMLIARRDPILMASGRRGAITFTSDFTFIREGERWQVAEHFFDEYVASIVRSRNAGNLAGQ